MVTRLLCIADADISYNRQVLRGVMLLGHREPSVEIDVFNVTHTYSAERLAESYDGFIVASGAVDPGELAKSGSVVAVTNDALAGAVPQVVTDDAALSRIVAEHLIDRGYRHLAFCGTLHVYAQKRFFAFQAAVQEILGVEVFDIPAEPAEAVEALKVLPRPLGVMAANDSDAAMLVTASRRLELRVPGDVAVVGVDNDDVYTELTVPPLSSVVQQTERIGFLAATTLLQVIDGVDVPQLTLVPPGPLIVRASSDTHSFDDPLVTRAIALMTRKLADRINIDTLVTELDLSRRSLELRFRTALGRSPGQHLLKLRIDHAKRLLATTGLTIARIAELTGFSHAIRLNQAFKRETGQTPGEYRRRFALP